VAARVLAVHPLEDRLRVEVRHRGSSSRQVLEVDRLIQCTGLPSIGSVQLPPLLEHLRHRGLLMPDSLGIGLAVADQGQLLQDSGAIAPGLYTLGTPLRGQRWESIAVPELREQAKALACALLRALPPYVRPLAPLVEPSPSSSPVPSVPEPALLMRQLFDSETCTFTYLLADPRTGEAALVDPVLGQEDRDLLLLQELKLTLRFCLETHLHADHITSAGQLRRRTGCRLIVPAAPGVRNADRLLHGGERLPLGTLWLEVIPTPGHTPEHVAYRIGDHLFTGDCLLIRGCGRTDFQNGNASDLYDSLQTLLSLPETLVVYPGHDSKGRCSTTIREEREFNPRFAGRSRESFIQVMANLKLAPPRQISTALPANQYLGDLLPEEVESREPLMDQELLAAKSIEAKNKDIINDYLGMFI
ncbi:MAG: MBL fold metallo-hydrolase, partial [Cyanobium sp.]